jgi:16S rRNA (cytosine967-C5)-methyltransferase
LAAVRILGEVLDQRRGQGPEWDDGDTLDTRDRGFARHLALGVLRWLTPLEWMAGQLLNRPLKSRDRDIERLILIGLFQLWKGGTQPHAAVHATVEAARELGKDWAAGLVNAILRAFQRRRGSLLRELDELPPRHAHPDWLLQVLQADWPEAWGSIVAANNQKPPLWLRVNRQRGGRDAYCKALAAAGLEARPSPDAQDAIRVEPAVPVTELPGFNRGLVSVQDAAAQLAPEYLEARSGHRVLDACAAPGGKTCHLLERTRGIELTALDREARRTDLIRANLDRLGLECRVVEADATDVGDWWDGRAFDRILLDAPCSATGVIRRHPEIKWLRDARQVDEAARGQRRLLEALWPLLKPGGILVYATCSVIKLENSQQIDEFLRRHADSASQPLGQLPAERQILPGEQDMDGFYYARLLKPA